jgi:leucyl aminopeptidase
VSFTLDSTSAAKLLEREKAGYGFTARGDKDKMRLAVERWWTSRAALPSWEDKPGDKLERHLREIAAAIIVFAEQSLREHAASSHAWSIERKEKAQEAERQRIAEEERKRAERQAKLEQARIDHLLGQARALHQAEQIRAYVRAVENLDRQTPCPMTPEEFATWSTWALEQADRIDPVRSGRYRTRPVETA